MLRKKTTLVLSTCLATLGLGVVAVACGLDELETGRFADRAFVSAATRPANYSGPILRLPNTAQVAFGGRHLISVDSISRQVHLYRLRDGAELESSIRGESAVLSPSNQFALTNFEGKALLWNVRAAAFGDLPRKLLAANTADLSGFSPDSSVAWVVPHGTNQVVLFNVQTGQKTACLEGHGDRINTVEISHDNKHVITGSGQIHKTAAYSYGYTAAAKIVDNSCRIWDAVTGLEIQCVKTAQPVSTSRFVGNDRAAYYISDNPRPNVLNLPRQNPPAAEVPPSSRLLAINLVHKYTLQHGADGRVLDTRAGPRIFAATLSADGKRAVFCLTGEQLGKDGRMVVYDLPAATLVFSAESKGAYQQSVELSSDGRLLLTRDSQNTATLWSLPQ